MKQLILAVCMLLTLVSSHGQSLTWAKVMGGSGVDKAYANAVDAAGNQYITGHFSGTADFDPGPGVANLTSVGAEDIFICKLNVYGDLIWVKRIGGTGTDWGRSIILDPTGNIYITGAFQNTCDFDPGTGVYNLSSAGTTDIFLCKLDASGSLLWAQKYGSTSEDNGDALTLDGAGNVYMSGGFHGTVDFDAGPGVTQLTASVKDVFITKMTSSGNLIWAKKMGGGFDDEAFGIAVDASGNVYTTGSFMSWADMDPGPGVFWLNSNVIGDSWADMFVSKLDASGNFVWAKQLSGWNSHSSYGYGIAVDGSGNVYTTGSFGGTIDFDPGTPTNMIPAQGSSDGFALKLSSAGDFVWVKVLGGCQNEDYATCIKLDAAGNVYTVGVFRYIGDFDPGPGVYEMHAQGGTDVFISKLTSSGSFVWAKYVGGGADDYCYSIALDPSNNIYLAGHFLEWADVDPDAGMLIVGSAGAEDIFVERLGPMPGPLPVKFDELKAFQQNSGARVEWSNLTESNVVNYSLERSGDGQAFTELTKISPTKNDGGPADYSFFDPAPLAKVNYYRIQSLEIDGKKTYSNIARVSFSNGKTEILVYPNPIIGHALSFDAHNLPKGPYTLQIINSAGQIVQQMPLLINELTFNKTINLTSLKAGIYHLQLNSTNLKVDKPFIIQ